MVLDVKSFWQFSSGEDSPGICCPRHSLESLSCAPYNKEGENLKRKQASKSKCQIYLETPFDNDSKIKDWTNSVIFIGSTLSPPTLFIAQSLQSTKRLGKQN